MGKMFVYNDITMKTWNPWSGCEWNCSYCWARRLITTRLKDTPKYKECGFKPTFHPSEMNKKFAKNDFVFISSLGDISFAPPYVISEILAKVKQLSQTNFLFCTKNPKVYLPSLISEEWNLDNLYLGCTIETNRDTSVFSKAPIPEERFKIMSLGLKNKFLSIEPVMDFDVYEFTKMVIDIQPEIVEIGSDNYHSMLPEPSALKIKVLISSMQANGIQVVEKDGLKRILEKE
jgi:protein gp37